MVNVLPYVLKVVVLAPRPDALLTIHGPPQSCQRARRVRLPQEYRLELVETRDVLYQAEYKDFHTPRWRYSRGSVCCVWANHDLTVT